MEIRISFIVPFFNAEQYLDRCVQSILSQRVDGLELLLVDDGSSDGSTLMADNYAKNDSRVHVFHKRNGGVSSARNVGLENARGFYVTFVDADDFLYNDAMTESMVSETFDVVRIPCDYSFLKRISANVICRTHKEVEKLLSESHCNACWARLYRRELIGKIRFDESLNMGEDTLFFVELYARINSFHWIAGTTGYHYTTDNEMSLTHHIGLSADLELLIERLHCYCRQGNSLAWAFLLDSCYINSIRVGLLKEYYRSFGLFEVIFAPIGLRTKCRLLKSMAKAAFFV